MTGGNKMCIRKTLLQLLSISLRYLSLLATCLCSSTSEQEALVLLGIKMQWKNQQPLQLWNASTSPCLWPAIQCSQHGSVTGILLGHRDISGEIPPSICHLRNLTTLDLTFNNLEGEFPKVLYNFTKLQKLDLSGNLFVGKLPDDINSLSPNLHYLNLSYNNFTGDIPSTIGQLKGLLTLDLQWNLFNGTFPPELGNLAKLEELIMAYNPFSPARLPTEFGELKRIKFLWMSQCNLIGQIPESFGSLHSLEHLDLAYNSLKGGIPSGLFVLKKLKFLYLYDNMLSGEIPILIEAQNLLELDLSENNLTGIIPQGIASLPKLEVLDLFTNQFHGNLPPSIGLIPTLKSLRVSGNKFTGPLPSELGLHSRLEKFEVNDNYFIGQLPESLCLGGALSDVVADNNRINGSIPKSLGQCNSLRIVHLNNNYLTGEIPEGLWSLDNLSILRLSKNLFSDQLPSKFPKNMTYIEISNNGFYGIIPPSVGDWQNLIEFKASNNLLSGTIPLELTNLSRLTTLYLDGNHLSGNLPSKIIAWEKLNSLYLSRNEFTGSIPSELGSLPVLNYLDFSNNQLSGEIPPILGLLKLSLLNFSSNKLTGRIPYEFDNGGYQTSFMNTNLCSINKALDLPRCKFKQENAPSKAMIIVLVLSFLVIMWFVGFKIFALRKRKQYPVTISGKLTSFQKSDITIDDILPKLTKTNLIGSGGSGKVYRIPVNGSWNTVAAKKIQNKKMRNEKEFETEVKLLSEIRHRNIIKLICCISSEKSNILVYEYMENRSLDQWIHIGKGKSVHPLISHWPSRLKIATGAAKGLSYMHHGYSSPIIHRDVKSSNILLDSEFNPKIADFGIAKILTEADGVAQTVSSVVGSFGYMAPEYCHTTKVNEKIDVYSFGVVLLELVTGKEAHYGNEDLNLAQWAWKHIFENRPIVDALDKKLKEDSFLETMITVFELGLRCTDDLPSRRPSMKDVLQVLQQCDNLETRRREEDENECNSASLLGSGSYVSSCRNSRKTMDEDDYDIV